MIVVPVPVVRDGPAVAAPLWQRAQARALWRPVSGNGVAAAWSNDPFLNVTGVWQEPQSCLNCPACTSVWQSRHAFAWRRTWVGGLTWQAVQGVVA